MECAPVLTSKRTVTVTSTSTVGNCVYVRFMVWNSDREHCAFWETDRNVWMPKQEASRPRWSCGLRRKSAAPVLLGSQVGAPADNMDVHLL